MGEASDLETLLGMSVNNQEVERHLHQALKPEASQTPRELREAYLQLTNDLADKRVATHAQVDDYHEFIDVHVQNTPPKTNLLLRYTPTSILLYLTEPEFPPVGDPLGARIETTPVGALGLYQTTINVSTNFSYNQGRITAQLISKTIHNINQHPLIPSINSCDLRKIPNYVPRRENVWNTTNEST